ILGAGTNLQRIITAKASSTIILRILDATEKSL
ncbi:unnamed protein product, partial [marine sediment metagenome]